MVVVSVVRRIGDGPPEFVADHTTEMGFRANFNPARPGDLDVYIGDDSAWSLPYQDMRAFLLFLGVPATDLDMAKYARKRSRRK